MPCDSGDRPCYEDPSVRRELDKVSRVLCYLMRCLEKGCDYRNVVASGTTEAYELRTWWAEHKRLDEARIKREEQAKEFEKKRRAALSKLSEEDKKILNIKHL